MEKEKNLRSTPQRKVILEELRKLDTHPSADEVYGIVRNYLPRISLGTVYRNLEILTDTGKIQKLELSGALKRYDRNTDKHYHIRCIRCNRVVDAPIPLMHQLENDISAATDFIIIGHNLEFTGLCPACSREKRDA